MDRCSASFLQGDNSGWHLHGSRRPRGRDALLSTVLTSVTHPYIGGLIFPVSLPALSFLLPGLTPKGTICTQVLISGSISGTKIVVQFVPCLPLSLQGSRRDAHGLITYTKICYLSYGTLSEGNGTCFNERWTCPSFEGKGR